MKIYSFVDGVYSTEAEVKRSRFITTVCGEVDSDGAERFVKSIKKKYPDATHNCYAYISDIDGQAARFSDDGEPSGTAGQPILEVLKKRAVVRSAIVVTRYFGGIKLGAGGLVSAYADAAARGLDVAIISQKEMCASLKISAEYDDYAAIESYARRKVLSVTDVVYDNKVSATVWIRQEQSEDVANDIVALTSGRVRPSMGETQYKKTVQGDRI